MKGKKLISLQQSRLPMLIFACAFAVIGGLIILRSQAAPGACVTDSNVIGTASYSVSVPQTTQYRLWVRMQVPDTANANLNGVRVELAGNQCFLVTTTNSAAVNQWQWINYDANAASTPHITTQLNAGTINVKILGLKNNVKVDKVLLLRSDNNCVPSNNFNNGQPGENCTVPAPTVTLTADSNSITSGTSTTLNWSSTNATTCTASDGWSGTRATSGSASTGNLTSNQTFTLTCTGIGGSGNASTTVNVTPPPAPTVTISANPTSVTSGNASTLSWSSTNTTTCTASGGWSGSRATSGNASTGPLTSNQTFTLSCSGPGGNANASASVTVTPAQPNDTTPPVITMDLPGLTVPTGQTSVRVNNLKSITWRPLAADSAGIKTLVLTVNGQGISLTNGAYVFGGQPNGNGDYVLRAVATDNNDNVTTTTLTIRLRHPDFNRDGVVSIFDLSGMLTSWDKLSTNYDLLQVGTDGEKVNIYDLSYFLSRWGSTQ